MRVIRVGLVAAVAAAVMWPSAGASGGGWWSTPHFESKYAPIGRTFVAQTEFAFASLDEAERIRAEGAYVYLLSEFDQRALHRAMGEPFGGNWWDPSDAVITRVGEVQIRPRDGLWRASTEFEVPDVAPGRYWLMFCDAGCRHSFGDVIPVPISVVTDPAIARLDRAVLRLRDQARARRSRLWQAERKAREARDDVSELSAQLAVLRMRPLPETEDGVTWWAFAGWLLAGASLAGLVVSARSRRRRWNDLRFDDLASSPEQPERERIEAGV